MAEPSPPLILEKVKRPRPMSYADEPDPFLDIRMVKYPTAVLQPRQECPVIEVPPRSPFQLSSTGVPLSTGTVWAGAAYDVDARPTSSIPPRRPDSPRPRPQSAPPTCGLPAPRGPPVPLTPRSGEAGSTSEKSSGAPLSTKRTKSPERASQEQRARSTEPPHGQLEQLGFSVWNLIMPAELPLEQARSSDSSLTVPPLPQGPRAEDIPVPETPPSGAPLPVSEQPAWRNTCLASEDRPHRCKFEGQSIEKKDYDDQLGGSPAPRRKPDLTVAPLSSTWRQSVSGYDDVDVSVDSSSPAVSARAKADTESSAGSDHGGVDYLEELLVVGHGYVEVPHQEGVWAKEHWEQEAWSPPSTAVERYWGSAAAEWQDDEEWSETRSEQWQRERFMGVADSPWPADDAEYWHPPATKWQGDEAYRYQDDDGWDDPELEYWNMEAWKQVQTTPLPDGWVDQARHDTPQRGECRNPFVRSDPNDRPHHGFWVSGEHTWENPDPAPFVWPNERRDNQVIRSDGNLGRRKRKRGGRLAPGITADFRAGRRV